MRISRRTSGGRGEYEISEDFEALTPRDLFERRLILDLGNGWRIDTGTVLRHQGGKRRIRRLPGTTIHLHLQVAAALLMPHPNREEGTLGSGQPILKARSYAIEHINLRRVTLQGGDAAVLEIDEITLRNYNLHAEELQFRARLGRLAFAWERVTQLPDEVGRLLAEHEQLVHAGGPIPSRAEEIVAELQDTLTETGADLGIVYRQGGEDALPDLLQTLEWGEGEDRPEPEVHIEEVDPGDTRIKRRVLGEWKRWVSSRGAKSARFREEVREAYQWTCVICGLHLPRTGFNRVAGVDGAHILPWAEYDLDEVSNGVCLCKHHHWAFDEGLLRIRHDGGAYYVEVPQEIAAGLEASQPALLAELNRVAGAIPAARLPGQHHRRPQPQFLEILNQSQ